MLKMILRFPNSIGVSNHAAPLINASDLQEMPDGTNAIFEGGIGDCIVFIYKRLPYLYGRNFNEPITVWTTKDFTLPGRFERITELLTKDTRVKQVIVYSAADADAFGTTPNELGETIRQKTEATWGSSDLESVNQRLIFVDEGIVERHQELLFRLSDNPYVVMCPFSANYNTSFSDMAFYDQVVDGMVDLGKKVIFVGDSAAAKAYGAGSRSMDALEMISKAQKRHQSGTISVVNDSPTIESTVAVCVQATARLTERTMTMPLFSLFPNSVVLEDSSLWSSDELFEADYKYYCLIADNMRCVHAKRDRLDKATRKALLDTTIEALS